MFNIDDIVVHKREVCRVKKISKKHFKNEDYYILHPIYDSTSTILVPIANRNNNVRPILSKDEVDALLQKIPSIPLIECGARLIENEYKQAIASGKHEDLIKIIKTTYLRNQDRVDLNRKLSEKDTHYLLQAEQFLYKELSIVLDMSYEETRTYVINEVSKMEPYELPKEQSHENMIGTIDSK